MSQNSTKPDKPGQVADAIKGNWVDNFAPIKLRPYLRLSRADRPIGTWLLLIPLAISSSKKMMKLLKHNWKKLHRLVYIIAIFGSLHFIWLSKTIFFKPLIYTLIILFLLSLRIKFRKNT